MPEEIGSTIELQRKEKLGVLTERLTSLYGVNTAKAVGMWMDRTPSKQTDSREHPEGANEESELENLLKITSSTQEKSPDDYLRDDLLKGKFIPALLDEHKDLVLKISADGGNTFGEDMDPRLKEWGTEFQTAIGALSEVTYVSALKKAKSANESHIPTQQIIEDPQAGAPVLTEHPDKGSIMPPPKPEVQEKPKQNFLVTRNGELVEVAMEDLTQEEKASLGLQAEEKQTDDLKPDEITLERLMQENPIYDYTNITPEMVDIAVEWAISKGISPFELGPAQIILAQGEIIENKAF